MRVEFFADTLLIILIFSVIAVILIMVNRGKKKPSQNADNSTIESDEDSKGD